MQSVKYFLFNDVILNIPVFEEDISGDDELTMNGIRWSPADLLRYNKIKFVYLSVSSNRHSFLRICIKLGMWLPRNFCQVIGQFVKRSGFVFNRKSVK